MLLLSNQTDVNHHYKNRYSVQTTHKKIFNYKVNFEQEQKWNIFTFIRL